MNEPCPHFGTCGGCLYQDVPYPEQLQRKQAALQTLFQPFWEAPIPIEPAPAIWNYRNKLDFAFGRKWYDQPPPPGFPRESVLGFKTRGRWYAPLDIAECRIGPEGVSALLTAVRTWFHAQNLEAFDSRHLDGLLKILLVREGKRTGERLVLLTTAPGPFDKTSFVKAVQNSGFPVASLYHGVFHGTADVAAADEIELLDGAPVIHECLHVPGTGQSRPLRFRLSPFSFFQTNTLATERLYGFIRAWVRELAPRVLYDLYGGMGGIALACADLVERVRSVESIPSATEDGLENARQNHVENVFFTTEKVEKYLKMLLETGGFEPGSAVILDPPRAGLHPKALERLITLRAENVLYISCLPKVLAKDLPLLQTRYRLASLQAVDLFPHTDHVEVLAGFRR